MCERQHSFSLRRQCLLDVGVCCASRSRLAKVSCRLTVIVHFREGGKRKIPFLLIVNPRDRRFAGLLRLISRMFRCTRVTRAAPAGEWRQGLAAIRRDMAAGALPACPWRPKQSWHAKVLTSGAFAAAGIGGGSVALFCAWRTVEATITATSPWLDRAFSSFEGCVASIVKVADKSPQTVARWLAARL